MKKQLTKKEKKFCKLYLKTRDMMYTKLMLGYTVDISKKHIRQYIQSKPIKKDFEVDLDPILRRLYAHATFDHASMYDKDGDVKPYKCLTDEQKMAIKTYKISDSGHVSYTVYSQTHALERLYTHKMAQDKNKDLDKEETLEVVVKIDPRSRTDEFQET
jgi:hypothetical protein